MMPQHTWIESKVYPISTGILNFESNEINGKDFTIETASSAFEYSVAGWYKYTGNAD